MTLRCGRTVAVLAAMVLATAASMPAARAGLDCQAAANDASRRAGLPAGLLAAIGLVESGRAERPGAPRAAWPDTVDADGSGHWFATEAEAAAFVRTARADGARSIDVGCFQIDLEDHPDAFATLHAAFDPATNADYAAGFLARLHARLGSWTAAMAAYHSAIPALGAPYAALVEAAWHGNAFYAPANSVPHDAYVIHLRPQSGSLPNIVTP
jgi:soluble lytic murein transglycosylase-like protein